jgi:hypothetical protein
VPDPPDAPEGRDDAVHQALAPGAATGSAHAVIGRLPPEYAWLLGDLVTYPQSVPDGTPVVCSLECPPDRGPR